MVMLCKALLLHEKLKACRLVVVTDRRDLEKQLAGNFLTGGAFGSDIGSKDAGRAKAQSGRDLAKRIGKGTERIIFTIINKFGSAARHPECRNDSADMIVLVDEGHRSQGGENHERMRKALPNAAYVAFTGTPLLKDDKTANKFGRIVHAYTMKDAVSDGTVTPLLYEERKPILDVNERAIDNWFEKVTAGLSDEQRGDLKKKFGTKGAVYGSGDRVNLIALDIATHFKENFKDLDLGLKGQLATDSKRSTDVVLQALHMAVWRRKPKQRVLIHSDQGSQFTSMDWAAFIRAHNLEHSMSRRGNCHDNAVAESFFSSLKRERIRRRTYKTREGARQDVFDYVEMFYNPVRKQVRNGMLSPVEFERQQTLKAEGV